MKGRKPADGQVWTVWCTVVLELQPKQKKEKKMFCWIAVTFDCHILISASLSPSELCAQFIETSSNGYRLLGNAGEWCAYGWAVRKHSEPRPRLSLAHKKITLLSWWISWWRLIEQKVDRPVPVTTHAFTGMPRTVAFLWMQLVLQDF